MISDQAFNAAVVHHRSGRLNEAHALYRQILAQNPRRADALHLLGVVTHQLGRSDDGVELIRRAIALNPNAAEYYCNLGLIFADRRQPQDAVAQWRQALARDPNHVPVFHPLGNALREMGRLDEALAALQKAVALKPDSAGAYSDLGDLLRDLKRLDESAAACRRAIELQPKLFEAHINLGNALNKLDRLSEAAVSYQRALGLQPNSAEACNNLGSTLKDLGQLDEAIAAFRRALVLNPDLPVCHSNLVYDIHYGGEYDPSQALAEARRWAAQHAGKLLTKSPAEPLSNIPDPDRTLRIGYVSPNFCFHPVTRFLLPLLEHHDRTRFEIYCYSDVRAVDGVTKTVQSLAAHWRNIVGLSQQQAAEFIRRDSIDILVDLAGHTDLGRLLVFAQKPAPLQISYLGYPGSSGLPEIDYRFTDFFADPPGQTEAFYSEELLRLKPTNWCFDRPLRSPPGRADRPGAAAPGHEQPICFGSFSNFAKLSSPLLDLWADILLATPGARLLVKAKAFSDPVCRESFARRFEARGVDAERLDLRGRVPDAANHLTMYRDMDIALDSFPYHGTTTTCEALWMGVPVVTLAGAAHVSRVGVSLLTNVGLPELVAVSQEDYLAIAVQLAQDRARLAELHRTLRQRMLASPLMDGPAFARSVESAYRQVWRRWCVSRSQS